jgi:hypoxanthine phosphoribosyltransferase
MMNNDIKEILFSHTQIVEMATKVAKEIERDFKDNENPPVIVGLLVGAVPFVAEVIKHIDIPVEIEFLRVKSYVGDTSSGALKIYSHLVTPIKGRDVVVIDDIIDTGLSMKQIINMFVADGAKSVKVGCMLEKKARHEVVDFDINYVGSQVGNQFVVGFGLDYNELYRNLPYIGVLKESVYKK